jgi:hypothetical protein
MAYSHHTPDQAPQPRVTIAETRGRRLRRWADEEDQDSGEDLASTWSQSLNSSDFEGSSSRASSKFSTRDGSLTSRSPKGKKLSNKALSKHALEASRRSRDETPNSSCTEDASGMSTGTPRSQATDDLAEGTSGGWSIGAALHDSEGCKPCLFVHTHVGCQNGASCEFCHYVHKRKSKPRPCKGKRDRYRKLLMRMEESLDTSSNAGSYTSDAGTSSIMSSQEFGTIASI